MGLENMGKDIVVLCLLAGSVLSAGCGKGGTVVSSCKAETPVSLDSLERRNIALRDTGGADTYYVDGCVRGYAMPMLADSTPFTLSNYSFVRVAPNKSYEMCRYGGDTVLEISNSGCGYFSFSFGWSYNGISPETADSILACRAVADTRDAARWCGVMTGGIASAADTLERHIREGGLKAAAGRTFDFMPANGGFRYVVSVDSVRRFSDAACVKVSFDIGPL